MLESEADRLAMIRAVGDDESFSVDGQDDSLFGVFDRAFDEASLAGGLSIGGRRPIVQCRTSDVEAFGLVKGSKLTRDADDSVFFVKDFEHDGTGMTLLVLRA